MRIDLLFLSCNRLHYLKHSIPALLADPTEEFALTIWDNASTDGSREFLEAVKDPRIVKKVLSPENVPPRLVLNQALEESSADLFGLVADDLLVTPGWSRILGTAHAEVPEFGRISCWHFAREEYDGQRARHKMQTFGRHQILRHPWTNGCGLSKLKAMRDVGLVRPGEAENDYWTRVALRGYVNGFYYPLVLVEHMDYPWSPHFAFADRFEEWLGQSSAARHNGIRAMGDAQAWHRMVIRNLLDEPWQVEQYVGWRALLKRGRHRIHRMLMHSRY